MKEKKKLSLNFLRTIAVTVTLMGAAGSLYFMFVAGRNQKSILLIVLFTAWVVSPFAGLFLANKIFKRWTVHARALLYWLMIILTIGSLFAYSGLLNTPKTKTAFMFLAIPFISWLLMVIVILTARRLSRKINNTSSNFKY